MMDSILTQNESRVDRDTALVERTEQVGLILVHGIGEQGRFEHLDTHIRGLIAGFKRSGARVTTEIMSAGSAAFQSGQDTWRGGPDASLRLVVKHDGGLTTINVHEVWWADINEPYSVMKQLRFWVWGLSVWRYPRRLGTDRPEMEKARTKVDPSENTWTEIQVRARLFAIGCIFLMSSLTIGLATVLAKRLLNLGAFSFIKVFVNYLSSVKLYNQSQRRGPGLGTNADFLDTIGEPPRDSIRRRMVRTMCDVVCKRYDRWYILAHSQGSVVAFNGLMEPGKGWLGYLDEERLGSLRKLQAVKTGLPDTHEMIPARPLWSADGEMVDRKKIFGGFAGLLTYGSPLEKFAAIWPACVAVFDEHAFNSDVQWVNIFDPIDPVSGVIHTWNKIPHSICPAVTNIGYDASNLLLLGHIKYLECPYALTGEHYGERLADHVAPWLLGHAAVLATPPAWGRFYSPGDHRTARRRYAGLAQWVLAFVLTACLAAFLVPKYPDGFGLFRSAAWSSQTWQSFFSWFIGLLIAAVVTTFVFGLAFAPHTKSPAPDRQRV